jgi:hypothetical protein
MKILSLVTALLLAGCGSGGSSSSCEINGQSGLCDPFKAVGGCLSDTELCRCAIPMDSTPSQFERLDCVEYCKGESYASGICTQVSGSSIGGGYTCGCVK